MTTTEIAAAAPLSALRIGSPTRSANVRRPARAGRLGTGEVASNGVAPSLGVRARGGCPGPAHASASDLVQRLLVVGDHLLRQRPVAEAGRERLAGAERV